MQQIAKRFDNGYAFYTGSFCCVYNVEKTVEGVILWGRETEGDTLVFSAHIFFSLEQEVQIRIFARSLAESKTLPRMMIELAEEYFSSASID